MALSRPTTSWFPLFAALIAHLALIGASKRPMFPAQHHQQQQQRSSPEVSPQFVPCPGGNCSTNVCQAQGLDCCQCQQSDSTSGLQVCTCCPPEYFCCPSASATSGPRCCPRGSTCGRVGCPSAATVRALQSLLACATCDNMTLNITCDNIIASLYVDGVSMMGSVVLPNDWTHVKSVPISADSGVIAVSCADQGVVPGVLASINNDYVRTDTTWKCTTRVTSSWMLPSYNDGSWPPAEIAGINDPSDMHGLLPQISPLAKWIWTARHGPAPLPIDTPVYCRGKLPTNSCDRDYGNCTNLCALRDGQCCACEMFGLGPSKVCSCCPQNYYCCPPTSNAERATCCPVGYSCISRGRCLEQVEYPAVPPRLTCGWCDS